MVLFDRSWYNRAGVERVMGFCTDRGARALPAPGARLRADAARGRDHPAQVLVQRLRRGAGEALPLPAPGPAQAVEALADGCRGAVALGRLLARQGRDVRVHRPARLALERGRVGREAQRPHQLHLAPAAVRPLRRAAPSPRSSCPSGSPTRATNGRRGRRTATSPTPPASCCARSSRASISQAAARGRAAAG